MFRPSRQHFRGDAPQLNTTRVFDRRTAPRREVRSPGGWLCWSSRLDDEAVEVHIVNLSCGGAGLLVKKVPPEDSILRLVLTGAGGSVVEGWAVGSRESSIEGWTFLHMRFSHPCPPAALERLLNQASSNE